jgi:Ca2+-binding RTX toxin-like protein
MKLSSALPVPLIAVLPVRVRCSILLPSVYVVDNAGDVIIENACEGTDIVNSSISYTLVNNIENLTLTGTSNINGAGNELNNYIKGNRGTDVLMGLAGNDTLSGYGYGITR